MTKYYVVKYDNEATGPFVAEGANLTWSGGVGFIVTVIDRGTTGKLVFALVSGVSPTNNQVLTQGSVTADADLDSEEILYPAYFREDVTVPSTGDITWTGPALGATHSFFFDGQTSNVVATEILTFSGGETCEVITVESDGGADGELSVRFISPIDLGLPQDNDTFTGSISGDGTINGVVHTRSYTPLHLHRLLSDLNDDEDISGNDDLSRVDATPSGKDTSEIVNLLGLMNISDVVAQHMFGGSVSQLDGNTLYSGVDVQVTSPNADTEPVLIQDDALVTAYWQNAYNPDSIAGNVRILRKTREDGVDIDGKRIKGKLAEFGDSYFIGGTTFGTGTTALALFSSTDGNNQTASATVAGAPYNTIAITEGYQLLDFNNGNGSTPYALKIDYGSASSLQTYERTKYIGRRGTAETLFSRNAILFDGVIRNFAYDGETGNLSEDEILAWGTVITYTGQTANLAIGEVVTFSGGSRARLLYDNDGGATGTLIFDFNGNALPSAAETMTGVTSAGDGTVGTVGTDTIAGTALLVALDDAGTTGNMYIQLLTGLTPVDNQLVYGATSNQSAAINGSVSNRTINNQFVGVYTGTNFQTNFGIAIDPTDAIVGDLMPNLLGTTQQAPNNQSGVVNQILPGDAVTVYPWNGAATDVNGDALPTFGEMTLATALVAGVTTTVDVGTGNIPDNTPASGLLRIERDSDGNVDLIPFASHNGDDTFTLVGTAPSAAGIGNDVMRAFIDTITATTQESYTSVFGPGTTQVAITVKNGSTLNGPIKVYKATATFGSTGFINGATRTDDS